MCGIVGVISEQVRNFESSLALMVQALAHRGPDANGVWFDNNSTAGLGHSRLAIMDLSDAGRQPMTSKSGRFVISFNGEIYNHKDIRAELNSSGAHEWCGDSDTEVLLAAIECWGVKRALTKLYGMFAFGLWDCIERSMVLARDPFGEKPLYYGNINGAFVFSSELKAIKKFPGFSAVVDRNALVLFLKYSSIPAPYSIYEGVHKLEPGCFLRVDCSGSVVERSEYWSSKDILQKRDLCRFSGSPEQAVDELERVLSSAVNKQMESDVPLGAFLSGGVDSSAVVALMQAQHATQVQTFSIGFDDAVYDEAKYARSVAAHLGTAHHDVYVSGKTALDVIPLLPQIYDEPFSDSSQIPAYLVASIAKQKVSVCLTGDAADELFGGYSRYMTADRYWAYLERLPVSLRRCFSTGVDCFSYSALKTISLAKGGEHSGKLNAPFFDKALKFSNILGASTRSDFYHDGFLSHNNNAEQWVNQPDIFCSRVASNSFQDLSFLEEMMASDILNYLPTDNLAKVDRASMFVSLETRVPFLDPDVFRFAVSLPIDYKIRGGVQKWVLKQVLYKYVPRRLIDRPKMGFAVPLAQWLRGPLRHWAEELLDERRLLQEGFFNVAVVRKKWKEHVSGERNWHYQLWDVLMFQSWLEGNN